MINNAPNIKWTQEKQEADADVTPFKKREEGILEFTTTRAEQVRQLKRREINAPKQIDPRMGARLVDGVENHGPTKTPTPFASGVW